MSEGNEDLACDMNRQKRDFLKGWLIPVYPRRIKGSLFECQKTGACGRRLRKFPSLRANVKRWPRSLPCFLYILSNSLAIQARLVWPLLRL